MAKEVDINGFWLIEKNPITREGVFPYSGSQIDFDGSIGLEANKIYNVYRPASELTTEEAIKSFNGDPLIDEHEMLGDGCTDYDSRPASGVMLNVRADDNGTGLVSDLKIYSEGVKKSIEGGKKELSLGYRCRYEQKKGVFGNDTYDFIQKDIVGNHIALVEKGRMGKEVRVFDSKANVFDSIVEVNQIQKGEDAMTDEEKAAQKKADIRTALDGIVSDAELEAIEGSLEPKAEDEEKPEEKEAVEDEKEVDAPAEDEDEPKEKAEDEDEPKEKPMSAEDAFPAMAAMFAERNNLVEKVEPIVGAFDSDTMTPKQVAIYTCKKIGLTCTEDEALPVLKGFLAAQKPAAQFSMDAAPKVGKDVSLDKYLEEGNK